MTTAGSAVGSSVLFVFVRSVTATGLRSIDNNADRVPTPSVTTSPASTRGGLASGPAATSTTGANDNGPIINAFAGAIWPDAVRLRSPVVSTIASTVIEAPVRPGRSAVMLASTVSFCGAPDSRSSIHCAPYVTRRCELSAVTAQGAGRPAGSTLCRSVKTAVPCATRRRTNSAPGLAASVCSSVASKLVVPRPSTSRTEASTVGIGVGAWSCNASST